MTGLEFRYVGQDRLPTRLSEFDVERYFALTDNDIAAINERFRHDRLAAHAIQALQNSLRTSGLGPTSDSSDQRAGHALGHADRPAIFAVTVSPIYVSRIWM